MIKKKKIILLLKENAVMNYLNSLSGLLGVNQVQELLTGLRVVTELSKHGGGDGLTVDFLDTSHNHAHVPVNRQQEILCKC